MPVVLAEREEPVEQVVMLETVAKAGMENLAVPAAGEGEQGPVAAVAAVAAVASAAVVAAAAREA